jgi:hypothetical protein
MPGCADSQLWGLPSGNRRNCFHCNYIMQWSISPDVWPGPFLLSEIYLTQGRPQDALPEIKLVRSDYLRTYLYALAYAAIGQEKQSDAALKELIAKYSTRKAFWVASGLMLNVKMT